MAIGSSEPVDPTQVAIDERLGELLLGSSAERFSRNWSAPRSSRSWPGMAVRTAFVEQLSRRRRAGPPRRCSPVSSMRTRLSWAQIEAVFGLPFYSPRDGSPRARERLALRLAARSLRWSVVGPRRPCDRQRTAAAHRPRRPRPAACRGRPCARVRRWVHRPCLARRRGGPRGDRGAGDHHDRGDRQRAQRRAASRARRAVRTRSARPRREVQAAPRRRDRSPLGTADGQRSTGGAGTSRSSWSRS